MENNREALDNNMFYNDNYINNYEELACCNTAVISNFFQENGANFLNYINNFCFNNIEINEDAQIINDPKQQIKTPLCSHNKQKSETSNGNNNNNIDNYINNNEINNNPNNNNNHHNSLNNSHVSEVHNPSNDSAAEPIMTTKKYDNMVNQSRIRKKNNKHRNRTNLFNVIKDVFKDFFTESNEEELNDNDNNANSDIKLNLKRRPILKRIIDNEIISPLKQYQNQIPQRNLNNNNNNVLRHANSHIFRRPQLFADNIISFNISEENDDENVTKLVSIIPVFTVKEKNINNNNKCAICLSDFEVGEKKSTLPCMHSFHYNCIERWIKKKKSCPICKFEISFDYLKSSI